MPVDEFLYGGKFRSENDRRIRPARWVHGYNCHRRDTAVGDPSASRAHNLTGTDCWRNASSHPSCRTAKGRYTSQAPGKTQGPAEAGPAPSHRSGWGDIAAGYITRVTSSTVAAGTTKPPAKSTGQKTPVTSNSRNSVWSCGDSC